MIASRHNIEVASRAQLAGLVIDPDTHEPLTQGEVHTEGDMAYTIDGRVCEFEVLMLALNLSKLGEQGWN